ncbi:hypothetical protein [Paenibacillus sp. TH7-28]
MYYIKDAEFTRMDEQRGRPCAVIQVRPGAVGDPDLFVYIARSGRGEGWEIVRMIRSDARAEIDWYDNNMHQAYTEVTEEHFGDTGWPDPAKQRRMFLENLLANEAIAAKLKELPLQ